MAGLWAEVLPIRVTFRRAGPGRGGVHMYIAGYIVSGFLLASVYAYARLRGRWGRYERAALAIPLGRSRARRAGTGRRGRRAARDVAGQPAGQAGSDRRARADDRGAPEHLSAGTTDRQDRYGIRIPHGLSVLAFHSWNARVEGLDAVPPAERPPVNVVRFSFQTMVGIGTMLALLGVVYRGSRCAAGVCPESRWFYRALVAAGPFSVVALIAGWVTTEVGRQPWVVYRVMPTADAVTGAGGIPVGYSVLALTYVPGRDRSHLDAAPARGGPARPG